MARFFSRFFRDAKCLYYLLTLEDELHLVSIENSVVKKKRERISYTQLDVHTKIAIYRK